MSAAGSKSVHDRAVEILLEKKQCSVELLLCIERSVFQLVILAKRLVFMYSESVIWKNLYPLQHLEVLEMLSQGSDVLFEITDARNKHISEPERLIVFFKPLCCLECLCVAPSCKFFVSGRIELLAIEKNQISVVQELFHRTVPDPSVGVYTDVYPFFLETLYKRNQLGCLSRRLSS